MPPVAGGIVRGLLDDPVEVRADGGRDIQSADIAGEVAGELKHGFNFPGEPCESCDHFAGIDFRRAKPPGDEPCLADGAVEEFYDLCGGFRLGG